MVSRVAGPVDIRERVQGGWQNTWLGSEPCSWSYAGKECTVGDEMHGSGVHGMALSGMKTEKGIRRTMPTTV